MPKDNVAKRQKTKGKHIGLFVDEDVYAKMLELGKIWGPVVPVSISDVVRVCIKKIHESETFTLG